MHLTYFKRLSTMIKEITEIKTIVMWVAILWIAYTFIYAGLPKIFNYGTMIERMQGRGFGREWSMFIGSSGRNLYINTSFKINCLNFIVSFSYWSIDCAFISW